MIILNPVIVLVIVNSTIQMTLISRSSLFNSEFLLKTFKNSYWRNQIAFVKLKHLKKRRPPPSPSISYDCTYRNLSLVYFNFSGRNFVSEAEFRMEFSPECHSQKQLASPIINEHPPLAHRWTLPRTFS